MDISFKDKRIRVTYDNSTNVLSLDVSFCILTKTNLDSISVNVDCKYHLLAKEEFINDLNKCCTGLYCVYCE